MRTSESGAAPPTWMDFYVYRLVKIELHSLASTAASLGITGARVCEVVIRVGDYLLASAPGTDDEAERRKQLQVSMQLAAERIEFLHSQAMQAFRRSQQETIKLGKARGKDGRPEYETHISPGDPKFLMAAAKLALIATKLPPPGLDSLALQLNLPTGSVDFDGEFHPPEHCSAPAQETPVAAADAAPQSAAKPLGKRSSKGSVVEELLSLSKRTPPVQQRPAEVDQASMDSADFEAKRRQREEFLRG